MILITIEIFVLSFLINLLWEVSQSVLYETCLKLSLKKYIPRIIRAAFNDGVTITIYWIFLYLIFQNQNPLQNYFQLIIFSIISLLFSFIWEIYAQRVGLWKYSSDMPTIFGVGVTPFIQIFLTGLITFAFVFLL